MAIKLYDEFLQKHANQPMDVFVETGVGNGHGLAVASRLFRRCFSVEIDKKYFESAAAAFRHKENVAIYWNSSPVWLMAFADVLKDKVVTFWLDAHYGGKGPAPEVECPLMEELAVITAIPWQTKPVIMIDDAYYFGAGRFWRTVKAKPYTQSKWPSLADIAAVTQGYDSTILWHKGRPKVLRLEWKQP